jgi:tetratricopeptide (TPR) repeat protein
MAQKRTLLFVVDIILWCDDATIDFLSYLCDRDFFNSYSLLVINSRKEDFNAKVEVFINRNTIKGLLEKIEVPPLTIDETALFLQKMTGTDPAPQFLDKFFRDTGGNPFFLVEGLKSLLSLNFDIGNFSDGGLYPVPDTVRSLIHEKMLRLSQNAFAILQAGAILGQHFSPAVAEQMVEMSSADAANACEELENMSIVSVRDHPRMGPGYFFDHDQVREVVLREMSPLRKRHLHLGAVNALIDFHGQKPELESLYAYHFERAGEWASAFNAWIQAAEFARTRFSLSDRYSAYERAFNLIPLMPQDALEQNVLKLVITWGDLAYDLSDVDTCEKLDNLCLDFGEQTQDPLLLGVGWSGRGRTLGMKLQVPEGIEAIKRAQFFLERTNNLGEKLEVIARSGILYRLAYDSPRAVQAYEEALQFLPRLKEDREISSMINILSQLGLMYIETGWPHKGIEIGEQAVNLSALVRRRSAKVQAAVALASVYYYSGNYQKSLENAQAVYSLAEKTGLRWWLSALDVAMGNDYLAIGNMDASWKHYQRAFEREKDTPEERMFQLACSLGGKLHSLYGDLTNAARLFKMGIGMGQPEFCSLENTFFYALVLGQTGKLVEARKLLKTVIEISAERGLYMLGLPARQRLREMEEGTAPANLSSLDGIAPILDEMFERELGATYAFGRIAQADGAYANGDLEAAEKIYRTLLFEEKGEQNIWVSITANLHLYHIVRDDEERASLRKEIMRILADLKIQSTAAPLRRMYYAYRKRVLDSL